jgi:hypothetical protein
LSAVRLPQQAAPALRCPSGSNRHNGIAAFLGRIRSLVLNIGPVRKMNPFQGFFSRKAISGIRIPNVMYPIHRRRIQPNAALQEALKPRINGINFPINQG